MTGKVSLSILATVLACLCIALVFRLPVYLTRTAQLDPPELRICLRTGFVAEIRAIGASGKYAVVKMDDGLVQSLDLPVRVGDEACVLFDKSVQPEQ